MFDRNDMYKGRETIQVYDEIIEENIDSDTSPRIIKLGKGIQPSEREWLLALIREFKDVFTWSCGDFKSYQEDVIQHVIPLEESMKPFR